MPPLTIMIKPVSGACNMRCDYCFYMEEINMNGGGRGVMTGETLEKTVRAAMMYADDTLNVVFQGGEPTLSGAEFYERYLYCVKKYNSRGLRVTSAIQTNALDIGDDMISAMRRGGFLVGASLDGARDTHDIYRKDAAGAGTFERVTANIARMADAGIPINILCVVTNAVAASGARVFRELAKYEHLQFIACLDPLDAQESKYLPKGFGGSKPPPYESVGERGYSPEGFGGSMLPHYACASENSRSSEISQASAERPLNTDEHECSRLVGRGLAPAAPRTLDAREYSPPVTDADIIRPNLPRAQASEGGCPVGRGLAPAAPRTLDIRAREYSLSAEAYGKFLIETYDLYEEALLKGEYVSVRLFDNYVNMLSGGAPDSCAMAGRCAPYYVIEADGSAYPCDFYALDDYRMGNIMEAGFARLARDARFIQSQKSSAECDKCRWGHICRGGCRRERDRAGLNRLCAGFSYFFDNRFERLARLARRAITS